MSDNACHFDMVLCCLFLHPWFHQVQHLCRDHPHSACWSFQGKASSLLKAVGVRSSFGHRYVCVPQFSSVMQ